MIDISNIHYVLVSKPLYWCKDSSVPYNISWIFFQTSSSLFLWDSGPVLQNWCNILTCFHPQKPAGRGQIGPAPAHFALDWSNYSLKIESIALCCIQPVYKLYLLLDSKIKLSISGVETRKEYGHKSVKLWLFAYWSFLSSPHHHSNITEMSKIRFLWIQQTTGEQTQ